MVFKRAVARVRSLRGAEVGGMRLHHRAAAPHLPPRHAAGAAHAAPGGARLPREAHVQRHGGGGLTLHVVGSSHAARLATVRVQRAVCTGSAKYPGEDGDFSALRFTRFANWLVPGSVMLGRYPYVEPGPRCRTTAQGDLQVRCPQTEVVACSPFDRGMCYPCGTVNALKRASCTPSRRAPEHALLDGRSAHDPPHTRRGCDCALRADRQAQTFLVT
jgi:hypothetical protein